MAVLTVEQTYALAIECHQAGRLKEAESLYRQVLARQPQNVVALHHLGVIAFQVGNHDIAAGLIGRAIRLVPSYAEAHNNLGNALRASGRLDLAIASYRQAVVYKSDYVDALINLGVALREARELVESTRALSKAILLNPRHAEAHYNIGVTLRLYGQLDQAIEAHRQAIAINPALAKAHSELGTALADNGMLDEAVAAFQAAIRLNPNLADVYNSLGNVQKDKGELDAAMHSYRHALTLLSTAHRAHSNILLLMNYQPEFDSQEISKEQERWSVAHAQKLAPLNPRFTNNPSPGRRLRIGYVSADFWTHASANFLLPLFEHHDPSRVELIGYADVLKPDGTTARIQKLFSLWRDITGLDDAAVAGQILEDRVDILIDLKLHTGHNRLLVFARKPAPLQVSWLGYPGSTGLAAIDYRLTDPYLDPPGCDESIYSERTLRLPHTFWCYDPLQGRSITVNQLPALDAGYITFGSLNNFCKINAPLIKLWARILQRVPDSRLLLLAHEGDHRQRTVDRFTLAGISTDRIEFVPRGSNLKYLQAYNRIDIGLDTFPYNGHTTSLDSFWMGVPVVTLVGKRAVSRAGWSQLSNLGLTELAGHTPEEFVSIATRLANDLPRLQQLRSALRQQMEQSPLMSGPQFARGFESLMRDIWRTWCEIAAT